MQRFVIVIIYETFKRINYINTLIFSVKFSFEAIIHNFLKNNLNNINSCH